MTEINLDKIIADQTATKGVREVYALLKAFKEPQSRAAWLDQKKLNDKAVHQNEMWSDKEKKALEKEGMVDLVINKCNKGVQGSTAIVTSNKPEIKVFPVGSGDLYEAELLKRAHDLVAAKNDGQGVIYDMIEESKVGGIGFIDVKYNGSRGMFGRIEFEETEPMDIYWSKDTRKVDFSDTDILKAKLRTRSYIKENYDNIQDADLSYEKAEQTEDGKSSSVTGADNYTIPHDSETKEHGITEQKNVWEIEAWLNKTVKRAIVTIQSPNEDPKVIKVDAKTRKPEEITAYFQEQSPEAKISIKIRKVEVRVQRIIVGRKQIGEDRENPHGEDADGLPVIPIIALPHNKLVNGYSSCPTTYALPINREKNKRRAQFIYSASQNSNAPIVEPEGMTKWTGNPGTPGSIVKVDTKAPFQPTRMMAGTFDIGKFAELETLADRDIDDQYDQHDVMRGKLPPGQPNASGRMVLALQDLGGMMSNPFLRKTEAAITRLAKAITVLVMKHWNRQMWERLVEPDEMQRWTPEGKVNVDDFDGNEEEFNDIKRQITAKWMAALERIRPADPSKSPGYELIDLDIRLTAGSSMPTNRIARQEVGMEMGKLIGQVDPVSGIEYALEYSDDVNKDKILNKLKTAGQGQPLK